MSVYATPLSPLVARHGEPLLIDIVVQGDQTGNTVIMTLAPRLSIDDAAATKTVTFDVGAPATANGVTTTPCSGILEEADVDDLVPGVVYIYRIRVNDGNALVWGTLEVGREWA